MARLSPKHDALRALFAKSGNVCAFPGCAQVLITDKNLFVGQICHIEAAAPGGERYNNAMTDEERRGFNNLLLLCYPHHVETDDINVYSAASLRKMKRDHELVHGAKPYKIDESKLFETIARAERYWAEIDAMAIIRSEIHAYPVEVQACDSFMKIISEVREHLDWLRDFSEAVTATNNMLMDDVNKFSISLGASLEAVENIAYHDHPFFGVHWEQGNIGVPNTFTSLSVKVCQLEIQYLHEYLKTHHTDRQAIDRLTLLEASWKEMLLNSGHID